MIKKSAENLFKIQLIEYFELQSIFFPPQCPQSDFHFDETIISLCFVCMHSKSVSTKKTQQNFFNCIFKKHTIKKFGAKDKASGVCFCV